MASLKKKIVSNAGWIIACKIIQAITSIIVSMLTARYLGPSNFGIINYAASLVSFCTPIMQLGLTNVIVQELTDNPEQDGKIVGTATLLNIISSLFCIGGITLFSYFANPNSPITILVCALYSLMLLFQAFELIQYWFQAKLLSKYSSIVSLVAYLSMTAYKVVLLVLGKDVVWFSISYSIDYFIISILLFIVYKKMNGGKLGFSSELAKKMFNKGKHYIVAGLMVNIFAQSDKLMIKHMMGDDYTGYYSAASTLATMSSFVFVAIIDTMRPVIFESKKQQSQSYHLNIKRLYSVIIYLSLLQSLIMTIFSDFIVRIMYGNDYLPASPTLKIIVWFTTFSYLGAVRNIWMLSEQKQKYLWIINTSGAATNIALNFLLIPKMGINGAALASLITQVFTNIVMGWIIPPIWENNLLMMKSLNPVYILNMTKLLFGKKTINKNGGFNY